MNKKNKKINYKYLTIALTGLMIFSATAICLYNTFNKNQKTIENSINQNLKFNQSIQSENIGKKVGNIRHWQNNNFSGIEVKNGGFVVLTGTQSATRIDAFGNILWEFDPQNLPSEYSELANKKVVEIVQDEGINQNILYLLLVPKNTLDKQTNIDPVDPYSYNELAGSNTTHKEKQATVVQITENINSYQNNNWTPSYVINSYININPKKMVDNYPSQWKSSSSDTPSFFSKDDHPSWYVASKGQSVSNTISQNTNLNSTMVLPWKQYITNLGNMFARNGNVFMFGGNGSIYNDPEALSIGMWKLDFNKNDNTTNNDQSYIGIPYAYLLKNIEYSPANLNDSTAKPNLRWNESYAPIGQTNNFTYVPRLAVGGIQTNAASSSENSYIYLASGITVGQVKESQNRLGAKDSTSTVTTIQEKRSLQLTGANVVNDPKDVTANSIDPALLFGTAFGIESLINLPLNNSQNNLNAFNNVFAFNSYFDIGTTMSVSSSVGTYYYFDKKNHTTSTSFSTNDIVDPYTTITGFTTNKANTVYSGFVNGRTPFPWDYSPSFKIGEIFNFSSDNNNNLSYSYNLSLLIGNAINYYYPTLSFGYSLKSIGGLTKVKMPSTEDPTKTIYGYAMQVGKSILYLNEPKSSLKDIAYHGPSSMSIGNSNVVGTAKYSDMDYPYTKIGNSSITFAPSAYKNVTDQLLSTGVGIYATGIKDFNDTVPTIASSFKISEDPYNTNNSFSSNKKDPKLIWNNFVGLNSVNQNTELSSLWLNSDVSKNTNNEYFITTKLPEISEYYGDAVWKNQRLFYNVQKNSSGHISLILSPGAGEKKAWFELENSTTIYGDNFSWLTGLSNSLTANTYYVSKNNNQEINEQFDVLLKTRDDLQKINDIFYGQIHKSSSEKGVSYRQLIDNYGQYNYNTILEIDRLALLGSGEFVNNVSNQVLTRNLNNLLETVDLSLITGNELNFGTKIKIVKQEFINEIFKISKQPYIKSSEPSKGPVIIVASNTNFISQSAIFTAYSWNSLTKNYDVMPRTNSLSINGINSLLFTGFSAMPDWVFPIIIAVPIVLVALIIGLGCGIGIPMAKHKKSIKLGFELSDQKVGTLTTAIGGVFKKLVDNSKNIKSRPQMLKASSSKSTPASKPVSKPNVPSKTNVNQSTPKTLSNAQSSESISKKSIN
ncbi:hypothetical protein [Mycoplasmoides pirum]|uniref:hypothetical protein n=1 Tax=Mycoplasmoides pirum TaxID=2122 RepID=UPI000480A03B|nr:hypothetical protein [Mycoplasmoides pirum]